MLIRAFVGRGGWLLIGLCGCTTAAPSAESSRRPVSSAMPPVVTASWKDAPSARPSDEAKPLDLGRSDHIRRLLLRQKVFIPHDSCKPFAEAGGDKRTLAKLAREQHAKADDKEYACDRAPSGHFLCNATYRYEDPESLLEIDFEATSDAVPLLLVSSIRCTGAG